MFTPLFCIYFFIFCFLFKFQCNWCVAIQQVFSSWFYHSHFVIALPVLVLVVVIVAVSNSTMLVQCLSRNNRSNQRHFKGKTIWKIRFGVPSTTSLVQETILLLQTFQQWTSLLSLFKLIPPRSSTYVTRNIHNIPFLKTRHTFLKISFFPSTIIEWNKLVHNVRNSSSFSIFRKSTLKFIRPTANSLFNCHNPKVIKFITRLRLDLSHLCEHQFKHSFQDSLKPFCSCSLDIESTAHFLHYPTYITERRTPRSTIEIY